MEDLFSRKELIYAIYREGSISRAAQKLFIAQPSLSVMVKKLEERMGLPLFDRTSKPLRLTEAGEEYIRCTEQIHHIESAFANYVSAVNGLQAGSLGIGSNQLLSSLVLPRYISSFIQRYPKIRLTLLDANSTTLVNQIMAGQLDIVIDNHELPEELFERQRLRGEWLLLAVPAAFPQTEAVRRCQLTYRDVLEDRHRSDSLTPVPLEAFREVPFLLMTRDNDTRMHTNAIFQEVGFSPRVLLEIDRLVTLYSYIEMGTAASVVSDTLVKHVQAGGSEGILFYKLPTEHARRDIFVSYKRNKYYSKAMEMFIESLHELE